MYLRHITFIIHPYAELNTFIDGGGGHEQLKRDFDLRYCRSDRC